jgi:hypothetical protein
LESPPASGNYLYNESGKTTEPLFSALMKLLHVIPANKKEGLELFQEAGYLLLDATYNPVNKLKAKERKEAILSNFCLLLEDLERINPIKDIPLILVKANICRILEPLLKQEGFIVENNGVIVPFPAAGQQKRFFKRIGKFHHPKRHAKILCDTTNRFVVQVPGQHPGAVIQGDDLISLKEDARDIYEMVKDSGNRELVFRARLVADKLQMFFENYDRFYE